MTGHGLRSRQRSTDSGDDDVVRKALVAAASSRRAFVSNASCRADVVALLACAVISAARYSS